MSVEELEKTPEALNKNFDEFFRDMMVYDISAAKVALSEKRLMELLKGILDFESEKDPMKNIFINITKPDASLLPNDHVGSCNIYHDIKEAREGYVVHIVLLTVNWFPIDIIFSAVRTGIWELQKYHNSYIEFRKTYHGILVGVHGEYGDDIHVPVGKP